MDEVLSHSGGWHRLIGGPKFPEKPLFNTNPAYGVSKTLNVEYQDNGRLKSVLGTNANGDTVGFDLAYDPKLLIATGEYSWNGKVELKISEWLDNNTVKVRTEYPSAPQYDVLTEVTPIQGNPSEYDVAMTIAGKAFTGKYNVMSKEIPTIAIEISDFLGTLSSTAVVSALEPRLATILYIESYKQGVYRTKDWQHRADTVGSILSDIFSVFVSAGYYLVSDTMADESAGTTQYIK